MNPLRSLPEYELFIYSLAEHNAKLTHSTLVVIRRGATVAEVIGELEIGNQIRLVVHEKLTFDATAGRIRGYGYEVWHGTEKLYWYDSQAHPNTPSLQRNHPHHKHIPPDIKHNRIPAPDLSFMHPNLPFLIAEIERELLKTA